MWCFVVLKGARNKNDSNTIFYRDLWDYMSKVSVEMNRLTDSVKEDPDKIAIYIKTAPEKR